MLQRAMSVRVGQQTNPDFINTLLGTNFGAMQKLGRPVLYPFLQVRLISARLAHQARCMIASIIPFTCMACIAQGTRLKLRVNWLASAT